MNPNNEILCLLIENNKLCKFSAMDITKEYEKYTREYENEKETLIKITKILSKMVKNKQLAQNGSNYIVIWDLI